MCGINGIFAYRDPAPVDLCAMRLTRDFMTARGPDGKGEWIGSGQRIAFGHRRLSIMDLSERGAQPMLSADGGIVVTFNGEIYNYKELRRSLESDGYVFQSDSDTEVLIHLYRRDGVMMVNALRGMFAFGLWDVAEARLLLARDPYGIKPLYYADDGRTIQFASSAKALLAGGRVTREPDPAGVVGFYLLGSVPEPYTTYRAIKSLPAGAYITVDADGARQPEHYFSIAKCICDAETQARNLPAHEIEERFRAALLDSVSYHLMADVPVGAFLSAGTDSGALVGLMRDAGQQNIQTVTLAFDEFRGTTSDESLLAEATAKLYGTHHTTRRIGVAEFANDLPKLLDAMDQPSVDGINTWFVSKAAHELGLKVAMSGVGGDELLGGYSTFQFAPQISRWIKHLPHGRGADALLKRGLALARSLGASVHPKADGVLDYGKTFGGAYFLLRGLFLPSELSGVIEDVDAIRAGLDRLQLLPYIEQALRPEPATAYGKIVALESCLYLRNQLLRDTDWAGMAHSLEIRTPLVDHHLLRRVAPLLVGLKARAGKDLLALSPRLGLPKAVVKRRRTGFSIPVESWFRELSTDGARGRLAKSRAQPWARTWAKEVTVAITTQTSSEFLTVPQTLPSTAEAQL